MPAAQLEALARWISRALQQHHRQRRTRLSPLWTAQRSRRQHHLWSHPQARLRAGSRRGHRPRLRAWQAHFHGRGRQLHRRSRAGQRLVRPRHPSLGVRSARALLGQELCHNGGRHRGAVKRTGTLPNRRPSAGPPALALFAAHRPLPFRHHLGSLAETADGSTTLLTRTNHKHLYWDIRQQLVHHTSNGCPFEQATSSPAAPSADPERAVGAACSNCLGMAANLLENGTSTGFIEDGDSIMSKRLGYGTSTAFRFGEIRNTVVPAPKA